MTFHMEQVGLQINTRARTLVLILTLGVTLPLITPYFANAQITTAITPTQGMGDLGTVTTPQGHTIHITGGTRSEHGSGTTLFHSFDQFSIGSNQTAQFLNTTPTLRTDNILSRVTSGSQSNIFGTIDTTSYPGANLFLMNPAGIVFGPSATLNVGGSVTFTTANYLRLADSNGSLFDKHTASTSLLTSASVAAFGFLGPNPPADIALQRSTLLVPTGQAISLIGGNITIESGKLANGSDLPTLSTPSKQVRIASLASSGELLATTFTPAANIDGQTFQDLGTVTVSQQSTIDITGRGGTIHIRGGRLVIDDSTLFANTGTISLDATSIQITNHAQVITETLTSDPAGPITLRARGNVTIDSTNNVGSFSTEASGHSGNVTIDSRQGNISLAKATVFQDANGSGNTGTLTLLARQGAINLTDSSIASRASGTGTLGDIQIQAHDLHLRGRAKIGGDNNGTSLKTPGNISVELDGQLSLADGSFINTEAFASAKSADLIISSPTVLITGTDSSGKFHSGLHTDTISSGNGGRLHLFTDNLELTNGGILSSKSSIGSEGKIPSGDGGIINVEGYRVPGTLMTIDGLGSGIFSSAEGTGAAGDISLKASSITVQNSGTISASTSGPGDAGNITISADSLTIASGGRVEASTSSTGTGGSIGITTTGDITVTGLTADGQSRSGIFAKTLSGGGGSGSGSGSGGGGGSGGSVFKPGKAGEIALEAKTLFLNGGAQIDSSTTSGGPGGTISIKTVENITIAGSSTRLTSDASRGNGKGGSLTLLAKNITVRDNASITAATGGKGDAGDVSLTTLDQLLLQSGGTITTSTSGSGKGGTIVIQANQVTLEGQGTRISADTLPPFADMTITINILHEKVGDLVVQLDSPAGTKLALLSRVGGNGDNFIGTQLNDRAPTQITSGSAPFTGTFTPREPLGQLNKELVAGNWALNVRDQTTGNHGSLENWTLQIGNQTFQSTGGPIAIPDNGSARSTITVVNPTVPTVQGIGEALGSGGNISLTADQSVTVRDGASISASSTGSGAAGNIDIHAGKQFDVDHGSITTQSNQLNGGNIMIQASDLVRVVDGKISTSALNGVGNGGNITIDPKVVLLQNSEVLAQAKDGNGGSINISTPLYLKDQSSLVSADSQFGVNGTVTIQSPISNLSGSVGQLVSKTTPPQVLLQNRCVALAGGEQSTFLLSGREALPIEPGGWLNSPVSVEHWSGEDTEHASGLMVRNRSLKPSPQMASQQNKTPVVSLRQMTPSGFLVQTFATGRTGCPS